MSEVVERLSADQKIISTNSGLRVSQACDRCRLKKIKCDGGEPCSKCVSVGFDCTTSDKLARRAFPKGYTVNLENRLKELEEENLQLKAQIGKGVQPAQTLHLPIAHQQAGGDGKTTLTNSHTTIQVNNPIDQIFNLDEKGLIIGNDNLNFESQFNHLLINLSLPFLKITNSHNYLLNDPDSYLYHRSYAKYNNYHNKDLDLIYNPLTVKGLLGLQDSATDSLPTDVYQLFLKLINNFKKVFNSKRELDNEIIQFFLNYNTFVPIFEYRLFMERYDAFHTMYPFMFTYDDATINGFNLSTNDYHVVNEYLVTVIQIYAMIQMNDPSLNLNLLLNHSTPNYAFSRKKQLPDPLIRSLYDFLPYMNIFHLSMNQLQTYLIFLYYSLLTNNKEKSLILSSLINAFIGILGVNLNSNNLFFNDLSLSLSQKRDRVKIFWSFKILLKCFNLKFGFKPTINTTVINPVTIEKYFRLTPEKLSLLMDPTNEGGVDPLFETLLSPSVEFLNLMNIVIPSSFSPNYYEYLKADRPDDASAKREGHKLDWILNDDDGDGNDGNLNYNYTQFLAIDKNLSNWRYALRDKHINSAPLQLDIGLSVLSSVGDTSLYQRISFDSNDTLLKNSISAEGLLHFANTGQPDLHTAIKLIKMQLNFHYLLIRSMNYLNFVIERELTQNYYVKIANISREVLAYFLIVFEHVGHAQTQNVYGIGELDNQLYSNRLSFGMSLYSNDLNIDDEGMIVNDFSAKRRRTNTSEKARVFPSREVPPCPFNSMLNGLSLTMINFKKSIILQMLYLLICNLKIVKNGGYMSNDTLRVLNSSIALFNRVFINYQPNAKRPLASHRQREDFLFEKIINDELKAEVLRAPRGLADDDDEDDDNIIDWDDEHMDEDLKYLKILKYIKYKTNSFKRVPRPQFAPNASPEMKSGAPGMALPKTERGLEAMKPTSQFQNSIPVGSAEMSNFADIKQESKEHTQEEEIAHDLVKMRNGSHTLNPKWGDVGH